MRSQQLKATKSKSSTHGSGRRHGASRTALSRGSVKAQEVKEGHPSEDCASPMPKERSAHSAHADVHQLEKLKSKFHKLDTDNDGQLSFHEICKLLRKGNPDMTDTEIKTLFDDVDVDHSGAVSLNEFVDYIFSPVHTPHGTPSSSCTKVLPSDREHLAALHKEFPYQCHIENAEHRAITISQLERVANYMSAHCGDWIDMSTAEQSRTAGQAISIDWANLYHVNSWIIRPATMRADCAFVELLAREPQMPSWFISHWWGEPICSFLKCVQNHCVTRDLSFDAPYWVCAYANRQHSLEEDVAMDPKSSSFYKALMLAVGVLLILDEETVHSGPATPFQRIWCLFEQAVALEEESKILDIAALHCDAPQLITEGVVPMDSKFGEGRELSMKAKRESTFPIEVMKAGFRVQIEKGNASVFEDRIHILNSISKQPLGASPLDEHENYERVNKRLSALFAVAAFPRAANDSTVRELQLFERIREDRWRTDLRINAWGWDRLRDTQALASAALVGRPNLITLCIQVTACSNLESVKDLGRGLMELLLLRNLRLEMSGCDNLKSVRSIAVGLDRLRALEHLSINLNRLFQVNDAHTLFPALGKLVALKTLAVKVGYGRLTHADLFCGGATGCPDLTELTLFFGSCGELANVNLCLNSLNKLKHFRLNLSKCARLVDIDELGRGMSGLTSLETLDIDISSCKDIRDMTALGRNLRCLSSLQTLKLEFRKCGCVPIDDIGASIANLVMLRQLYVDLGECKELCSVDELGRGISRLALLSSLSLRLGACTRLASVVELGRGCAGLPKLESFALNMIGCSSLPRTIAKVWVQQDAFVSAAAATRESF